ncbi:MAG: translational GTPase TypA [Candidatus Moranbacteria bacterium]|jgi:GTP-binding protein|nr:translational GTPase TypA [Candidatus Moranbacteria bacterium]
MDIRNIAIIAHVDHGKTTITDAIMKQTGAAGQDDSMDSNDLEKERGITIYAKNTSINYKDTKINIVDTPGHADFGSEVERVLRAIDSVVLVVDAQEGPMPQTRFVLKKSLELGHKPMVVINKIDKPAARLGEVEDEIFELFLELGATDEQLEFPIIYSIGKQGIAKNNPEDESDSMMPLLDKILEHVPAAKNDVSVPLRLQPFSLAYDDYLGRLAVARIFEGVLKMESVFIKSDNKETRKGKIIKIFSFEGTKRKEIQEALAGDIVMVAGIDNIDIGETICAQEDAEALPAITVDEPTIALEFLVNSSPFAGKEGEFVTREQIRERLKKELEINVGLKVDFASDNFTVYGRGELHVAVLLENMRREGFEVQVSQPRVIIKEVDGAKMEPFEELTVTVPSEFAGAIIEKLGKRKGIMTDMKQAPDGTRMLFEIPTRGALGYRSEFIVDTRGEGILSSRFLEFRPYVGEIKKRAVGSMISGETGKALGFSLFNLQQRGSLYVMASQEVYAGQVIGNTSKGDEMTVNPIKGKHLTNMRASGSDDAITLVPPIEITIEKGLEIMAGDEYLEITPKSVRLRKQFLTEADRVRASRKNK